jgi:hypothetical protein
MVSLITDLKLSVYSAAISALATFAERDASASGASLTIVLALWRSLTNALWQFLLETWWNSNRLEFHCVGGQGLNGTKSTTFLILSLARQSATSDKQEGYQ